MGERAIKRRDIKDIENKLNEAHEVIIAFGSCGHRGRTQIFFSHIFQYGRLVSMYEELTSKKWDKQIFMEGYSIIYT